MAPVPAGGLRGEHGDRTPPQPAHPVEVMRPALAARFLVRHDAQADTTLERDVEHLDQGRRVDHGRQAALHVGGPPAVQSSAPEAGMELRAALRRNHVVVAVEVERARPVAVEAEQVVAGAIREARRFHHLVREPEAIELRGDAVDALAVAVARRVLGGDADEVPAEGQDRFLAGFESLLHRGL